jgi:hypothetical protein
MSRGNVDKQRLIPPGPAVAWGTIGCISGDSGVPPPGGPPLPAGVGVRATAHVVIGVLAAAPGRGVGTGPLRELTRWAPAAAAIEVPED